MLAWNSTFNDYFTGGGGYTVKNVSRCWAYETAIALNINLSDELPRGEYSSYFTDENNKLHILPDESVVNYNTKKDMNEIVNKVFENLRNIEHVPSVQIEDTPHSFRRADVDVGDDYDGDISVSIV